MKRILSLLLAMCLLLLCGCAPKSSETQPSETASATAPAETEAETQKVTEAATESVTPYNPLTGEPTDEWMTDRPFAVILNNYESATPMHGVAEADVLYETLTEGGMTRCLGLYTDLASVDTLGSVRSARIYHVSLAIGYDAIFVHYGKSSSAVPEIGAQQYMDTMNWDHMDGTSKGYPYFYESQERIDAGYNRGDACHFLVGQRAIDYAVDNGFALTREEPLDYGLHFDDDKVIVGETADSFTVWFNQGGTPSSWTKYTTLNYDKETKQYLSYQYGEDNIDGNTGESLSFRNVIVLRVPTRKYEYSEHMIMNLLGEGEGYFTCNGQVVPIKWSRPTVYEPFYYTLEDGTPLTLGVGKSYIAIVPENATIEWE